MKKSVLAFMASVLVYNAMQAQVQEPKFNHAVEGIKEYSLPNGLKILLIPDAAQSNVVVNIVYNVGSRHEGYGETGMAHLLEHMLFKRSAKFTEIKKAIADKGASANGTTWYDRTNYYEVLPATDDNLKWALEMEADRMITAPILQSDLDTEFSVVRNEFEIGENDPSGVLNERIISTAYLWHNYGNSTIGSKEDIERVKAPALKAFYKKYYQPNNATLIVGGKFDEKKTLGWIKQFFGPIVKPTQKIPATYTVEPIQDGERFVELKRNGDAQYLAMAYHTPSFADKDFTANKALISILTNNPSGVLYKNLVETKLASDVYGYTLQLRDPAYTYFQCEVPKDKDINTAQASFIKSMNEVVTMTLTEEDLKRAKNELIKNFENTYNKTINLSIALTECIGAGDWRLFFINRDNIENLTLADVQNVAKKYYLPSNRTVGKFTPETTPERTKVAEVLDIDKLVKDYKGKKTIENNQTFEASVANILKNTESGSLPSGAKYALLDKPTKGEKIEGRILLRLGDEKSLAAKNQIAALTASMLQLGTTNRNKQQINDELNQFKTNISIQGTTDGVYVRFSTDKSNLKNSLAILNDLLRNPSFTASEFDKMILEYKGGLEKNSNEPSAVAEEVAEKETSLYPKSHPFYAATTAEKLTELPSITLAHLKQFYKDFYNGNHAVITFVGSLDKAVIKDFITTTLNNWAAPMPYKRIETTYFDVKSNTKVIQINDKTNAVASGKMNLNISENHPDYPAIDMANEMLGGGAFLSSRIPERLREAEGMSYGAGSYVAANAYDNTGTWGIYAYFNPLFKDKLDNALREEIQKALDKGFTKAEFDSNLASWKQQRQTSLGTDSFLVYQMRNYLEQGKTLKDFSDYEEKVKTLDVAKVNAALKKYFDPSKLILIYAGDFQKK